MARLVKVEVQQVLRDRVDAARDAARAQTIEEAAQAVASTEVERATIDCDECGESNRWHDAAGTLREAIKNVRALARATVAPGEGQPDDLASGRKGQ